MNLNKTFLKRKSKCNCREERLFALAIIKVLSKVTVNTNNVILDQGYTNGSMEWNSQGDSTDPYMFMNLLYAKFSISNPELQNLWRKNW